MEGINIRGLNAGASTSWRPQHRGLNLPEASTVHGGPQYSGFNISGGLNGPGTSIDLRFKFRHYKPLESQVSGASTMESTKRGPQHPFRHTDCLSIPEALTVEA